MTTTNVEDLLKLSDEDLVPPRTRVVVLISQEILCDKIVPKKAQLKTILQSGNLDPNAGYLLDKKPVDVNKTIYELLPRNMDQLTEVKLVIEAMQKNLEKENETTFNQVIKPCENPFRLLVFSAIEFSSVFKMYPPDAIKYYQLDNFSEISSAYCNSQTDLYISGGKNKNKGTKDFWKISNLNYNIKKLNDLPVKKENHSMIFVLKKIFFVGGNSKETFFYNTSNNNFGQWAPLNHEKISPALALINDKFLYAISEQKDRKKFDFVERTNLLGAPQWEKIKVKLIEPFPMKNFGAAVGYDTKIYFLGGRRNKGEKIYCLNTTKNVIEPCGQENSSLRIGDKTFYHLNKYNSALIPNELREDIQVILFNRQKNKFRKVHYSKDLEEKIELKDFSYPDDKNKDVQEPKNVGVFCKTIGDKDDTPPLPDKLIKFPNPVE